MWPATVRIINVSVPLGFYDSTLRQRVARQASFRYFLHLQVGSMANGPFAASLLF
jgi:hypothetical protein